ncbi:hypothetical protein TNCV_4712291 [Trichonephila clavipes]|nr:hypothetical protein TNCV_4712291 [Trichonephila clavipes]
MVWLSLISKKRSFQRHPKVTFQENAEPYSDDKIEGRKFSESLFRQLQTKFLHHPHFTLRRDKDLGMRSGAQPHRFNTSGRRRKGEPVRRSLPTQPPSATDLCRRFQSSSEGEPTRRLRHRLTPHTTVKRKHTASSSLYTLVLFF